MLAISKDGAYVKYLRVVGRIVPICLLGALPMMPQSGSPMSDSAKAQIAGEYLPAPQVDPTRVVALVPTSDVKGVPGARVPLFLERFQPGAASDEQDPDTKVDDSKAVVPSGIISFRVMMSEDRQWALVDLKARDAAGLAHVRQCEDSRVRIFTAEELSSPEQAMQVMLPQGLLLAPFLEP